MCKSKRPHCPLLLTGASGRLGVLLRQVWQNHPGLPRAHFVSRSACAESRWSPGQVTQTLPRCDTLIALWGVTSGPPEALALNSALAVTAHDLAKDLGATRVLHLSSAGIYGPGTGLTEASTPNPVAEYGLAKLRMEDRIAALPATDGITHCCLRLANVVGADSLAPGLSGTEPIELDRFPDGHGPRRSYIAPGMLTQVLTGLAALPLQALPRVLNVAARSPVNMEDLVRAAGRRIAWRSAPDHAVQTVTIDTSQLACLLPRVPIDADADRMIADWKMPEGAIP